MSEEFFGVSRNDVSEETDKQMKQNLKMAILAANNDKPIPPVYYLLKSKFMEYECAFDETHELPKELDEDDPRLLPSYATDVEATPYVQISSDNVSPPHIISSPCQQTPKENTTLLPVISPAEQCKSSKESRFPFVPVTLSCENGTFDEEWRRVSRVYCAPAIYVFYFFYMFSSSNIHLKNAHFRLDTWIAASCMWLEI